MDPFVGDTDIFLLYYRHASYGYQLTILFLDIALPYVGKRRDCQMIIESNSFSKKTID